MISRKRTLIGLLAMGCLVLTGVQAGSERLKTPSELTEKAPDQYRVTFEASNGTFVVEVTRAWSPLGADRFYNLVKNGFYDDTRFFRVVPNFVVQFGLNGDPEVNSVWRAARIKDDRVNQSNQTGFVSFATAGPNTRTTQVFINLKNNSSLDRQGFSPFGQVVEGMDVVEGVFAEYGGQPNQGLITQQGNSYLKEKFPKLDYIKKATIAKVERKTE